MSATSSRLVARCFIAICSWAGTAGNAQDTRCVSEPVLPDSNSICSVLHARMRSQDGDLNSCYSRLFDTSRIQRTLNHCAAAGGGTVELQAADRRDAFQIQPISIPGGVTLLVDPGVTVFGSVNPRDYDVASGSCGIVAKSSPGCKPLISVVNSPHAAIMGGGTIDGRGGDKLIGQNVTWWELARQAQQQKQSQYNPRLLQVINSNDFVLYQITLKNSPNFHVSYSGGDGFTAWGITIDTPYGSRNTDGIDPGDSRNVIITESAISDGDDNVAIGASHTGSHNITVSNNYFGGGHGISIGSYTAGGLDGLDVHDINISGVAGDHNDNGIRIKSDSSRGGLIQNVSYRNVCMQNVYNPIQFNPFYSLSTGNLIPDFRSISLRNIHVLTEGKVMLEGHDTDHPLGLTMDNVIFDSIQPSDITAQYANITWGPGAVNMPTPDGPGVFVANQISNDEPPFSCDGVFPGKGDVVTVGGGMAGSYDKIQAAVDALPADGGTININPGTYVEVVHVKKQNVRLRGLGDSPADVVITYNNSAGTSDGKGSTLGTSGSGTFYAQGDGFLAENLTIQNTFDLENDQDKTPAAQAVALYVNADRAVFRSVRIIGRQDSLYANGKGCTDTTCTPARQYFYNSYIEGNVDFIFGDGATVFDHCTIMVDEHGSPSGEETITAQSKHFTNYLSGYVFINSVIKSQASLTKLFLGRPWRQYSTNVFLDTYMEAPVNPAGWVEFTPGVTNSLPSSYYAEYRSIGPGAAGPREQYAQQICARASQCWEPDAFLRGNDNWRPTLVF